jgi:hypothetical protein
MMSATLLVILDVCYSTFSCNDGMVMSEKSREGEIITIHIHST